MNAIERIKRASIVPVAVFNDAENAVMAAKALLDGGIDVIEVTFRTAAAAESIIRISAALPDMLVGAGTIINPEQLHAAVHAGARFIVSPGTDAGLIELAQETGVSIVPGVATPSEIMTGISHGLSVFKFFPSEIYGGAKAIKALCGPFPNAYFIPTGGIDACNAAEYLSNPKVLAVGGSWMIKKDDIEGQNAGNITRQAKQIVDTVKRIRG